MITQEDKRILIANHLRWRCIWDSRKYYQGITGFEPNYSGDLNKRENCKEIPDYFNDLNACHEMEKVIFHTYDRSTWFKYLVALKNTTCCGGNATENDDVHATASQRAEAFGRTLNLWTPSS